MPTISPGSLLLILVIVLVIFGTKRLRSLGSDLGGAVKGFRSAMSEAEKEDSEKLEDASGDASFDSTPAQESKSKKDA
ncbi:MAG: twin-arginine translocase TatA/TatE family subunit [Gammaproteobacteria bacterium]|jgi:sec-independent protein translocase protein TatA|nr:twin-arginine translocase TatA/TatE family subunit [Gammaproteobacteria bacterium]MDH5240543.1 twin-arginine translocase TatA/TatE family subunit [Gammaproteobacteria bacterium]MDH5261688.1 twin-arginine translocase TatA/TatE family subunit [Gammaproteobacteria bacterium]MDH5584446.1 twin-arginine translocase TatA/TatE family subunit [Gammaproteobacteria bacterium]